MFEETGLEFQITAAQFLTLIRNRIKTARICYVDELTILGRTYFVERVEVSEETALRNNLTADADIWVADSRSRQGIAQQRITGRRLQVAQPVSFHLSELVARAPQPPQLAQVTSIAVSDDDAITSPVQFTIIFDVTLTADGRGGAELKLAFAALEDSLPKNAGQLRTDIEKALRGLVPPPTPIDVSQMSDLLGPLKILNAGISIPEQNPDYLALRLELPPAPPGPESWSFFLSGHIQKRLGNGNWSLLVGNGILTAAVLRKFQGELRNSKTFRLLTGPFVSWSNPNGTGVVTVRLTGQAIDACNCFGKDIDVNVDVTATVDFLFQSRDVLEQVIRIDHTSDWLDLFCCELTASMFWPILGADLLSRDKINKKEFIAGLLISPVGVLIVAIAQAGKQTVNLQLPNCTQKPNEDTYTCDVPFRVADAKLFGRLHLENVEGLREGLLLSGTHQDLPALQPASPGFGQPAILGWDWIAVPQNCDAGPVTAVVKINLVNAGDSPTAPLFLCEARVLTEYDPFGQFTDISTDEDAWTWGQVSLNARFPLIPGYVASPYPCFVLIKTNAGALLVRLPPVPLLTAFQADQIQNVIREVAVAQCTHPVDDVWNPHLFDPDPVIGTDDLLTSVWQVSVVGLTGGDSIQLESATGDVLGVAIATDSGFAQLSAILPDGDTAMDVRLSSGARAAPGSARRIEFTGRQWSLVEQSAIALDRPCRQLTATDFQGESALMAATEQGLSIFDLRTRRVPRLAFQALEDGLRGVLTGDDGFLLWGDFGLATVPKRRRRSRCNTPVKGVAVRGGYLFAAGASGIDVYDRALHRQGEVEVEEALSLAMAGDRLVAASGNRLLWFDLADPRRPEYAGEYTFPDSISEIIEWPQPGTRDSVLVRGTDGGASILAFDGSRFRQLARYRYGPWFAGTAHRRTTLGKLDAARTSILIYLAAKGTRLVHERRPA